MASNVGASQGETHNQVRILLPILTSWRPSSVRRSLLVTATAVWFSTLVSLTPAAAAEPDGCRPEPITANTPTGIAGCQRSGDGIASHYGPGDGVAMNYCTWTLRHSVGCGDVTIYAYATGRSVTVPVVDFCDCHTGTADERIVDLQYGVLERLGLGRAAGLYQVLVTRVSDPPLAAPPAESARSELEQPRLVDSRLHVASWRFKLV